MIRQFECSLPAGRQRMLALGRHYHEALAGVARRGLPAALELVDTLGGVSWRMSLARGIVALVARQGVPKPVLVEIGPGRRAAVFIPDVSWKWIGRRQVATLGWCCAFDVQPMPVRPLP